MMFMTFNDNAVIQSYNSDVDNNYMDLGGGSGPLY